VTNITFTLTPLDNIRKDSNRLVNPSNTFTETFGENDIVDHRIEYEMVYRQEYHDFPSRQRKDINIKASEVKKGDTLTLSGLKYKIVKIKKEE
jgi:hypothetical protein